MVHDKTGPDRKKLDRRNARQQPIKFKDSGFRTGKMLKKKINVIIGLVCRFKAPGGGFRNLKFDLLYKYIYTLTRLAASRTSNYRSA